ncbi:MAG TPA: helix-turn-helix transcriptional regulator [Gaiellaceae bacterium]|nr:helix-turn-helix transcriptional regulator [Gaiellaceae bacterium]
MDAKKEISEFLATRRGRVTPEQAGLPTFGGSRRVPGLRREEVALLAGVSADYYTRLERGNTAGVSEQVLEAIARALQLDEPERAHLFDLARAQITSYRPRRRLAAQRVRPSVQRMLDALVKAPAFVRNGRMDILGTNPLGYALYSEMFANPRRPTNSARFTFLDQRARAYFIDWEKTADDCVAVLRSEAGSNPHDSELTNLIGELSTQSEDFRVRWAKHNVRYHDTGIKQIHHPIVGELELTYEGMTLRGDGELTMFVYTAEPDSKTEDGLRLLGSWIATLGPAEVAGVRDES